MVANDDSDTTLRMTRYFAAPPARVFAAFLNAEVLQRIWSHENYTIVEMSVDPRVGGGWKMIMREEATGTRLRCRAKYLEIRSPTRLVWETTWLDGPLESGQAMRVTLDFTQSDADTRLDLTHECFPDSETRDHHGVGWGSGLDRLAIELERAAGGALPSGAGSSEPC